MASAAARYQYLSRPRSMALENAKVFASLIDPTLVNGCSDYMRSAAVGFVAYTGPRAVTNGVAVSTFASKMRLATFPLSTSFFRLKLSPASRLSYYDPDSGKRITVDIDDKTRAEIDNYFGRVVQVIVEMLGERAIPSAFEQAEKHAMVSGMGPMHFPKGQKARTFRIDQYVLDRDGYGNLLALIVKDKVGYLALTPQMRAIVDAKRKGTMPQETLELSEFDVYTVFERKVDGDVMFMQDWQEIEEQQIPGSLTEYKTKHAPWILLPWRPATGTIWSPSCIQERFGLHASHEGCSWALQLLTAMATDRKRFVKKGMADIDEIVESDPGDYVYVGDPTAIVESTLGGMAEAKFIFDYDQALQQKINTTYGIANWEAVERRTAFEASILARELNASNAGVFSFHAEVGLKPIIQVLLEEASEIKDLVPAALKELVPHLQPKIVAGLEALGQEDEYNACSKFLALYKAWAEGPGKYSNKSLAINRLAQIAGWDISGLLVDEEQMKAIDKSEAFREYTAGVPEQIARGAMNGAAQPQPTAA